jgi:hypothetical protein
MSKTCKDGIIWRDGEPYRLEVNSGDRIWHDCKAPWNFANMGVGDAIALSGGAVFLAAKNGGLVWPTWLSTETSIRSIFANHPGITVVTPDQFRALPAGSYLTTLVFRDDIPLLPKDIPMDLHRYVYAVHSIDYAERWRSCPIAEARKLVKQKPHPKGRFVFIHDDADRGYRIDPRRLPNLRPYRPFKDPAVSILSYCDAIEAASEVHVIDSSFRNLAEQIQPRGRLVYHQYGKTTYLERWNDYLTRLDWEIIKSTTNG